MGKPVGIAMERPDFNSAEEICHKHSPVKFEFFDII
jgi:hypothetical protein